MMRSEMSTGKGAGDCFSFLNRSDTRMSRKIAAGDSWGGGWIGLYKSHKIFVDWPLCGRGGVVVWSFVVYVLIVVPCVCCGCGVPVVCLCVTCMLMVI